MRVLLLCLLTLALFGAKHDYEWHKATVADAKRELSSDGNVAGGAGAGGTLQTGHEEFTLETPETVYVAEQWVVPQRMLRLTPGIAVQIAIDGKALMLKTYEGKVVKLKLLTSYANRRRQ